MTFDPLLPGPWRHQHVAANGARFHVATVGTGPPVLLLHGFPQFWWAWRHQLPALAEAGYRGIAMDLRGYAGSDKTPNGYDPFTLAADVAGVVRALGLSGAHLVGHGWGGYVAWSTALLHPDVVTSLATVSAPHPAVMLRTIRGGGAAARHVLAMQVPWFPERRLRADRNNMLAEHLHAWAAPGSDWPDEETVATYRAALRLWPAPHCALEYHRWLFRSRIREDGRRYNRALRTPVAIPTLTLFGGADPVVRRPGLDRTGRHLTGEHRTATLPGVGHFAPEEAPDPVSRALVDWLDSRSATPSPATS